MTDVSFSRPPASSGERIDGRRLRSARTKQLIIEAYLALLRDNPRIPTAAQIAERAGYSVRSVFERFPDLLALRVAATDYAFSQGMARAVVRGFDGDRPTRIGAHVQTRGQTCEHWLPLWRAVNANQGDSAELKERILLMRQAIIKRMQLMYAPELSTLPDDERHQLEVAIEALIDFESWARMRDDNGLAFDEACEVWIQAIDRLLPPTPVS